LGFFNRRDGEDREQNESLERLESGGIPLAAEQRLRELAGEGSMFTSALSVKEFALLRRMGPQPVAQVMGASVIRTGYQYLPALPPGEFTSGGSGAAYYNTRPGGNVNRFTEPSVWQLRNYRRHTTEVCELDVLAQAWRTARRRALDRLCDEALQVNADVVVGVRLHHSDHDLGRGTIEYVVMGTAVRVPGSTGSDWPILTDLSVQDYWRLREAGHEPVGFLGATSVMFASPPSVTRRRRARTPWRNRELDELSEAFRLARESVRTQIAGQVADAHGTGAVGVTLSHAVHRDKLALASSLQTAPYRGWNRGRLGLPYYVSGRGETDRRGWVITMHAAGTAVRPAPGPRPKPVQIKPAVRLRAT
jgi:Putative heavy-metal-binding